MQNDPGAERISIEDAHLLLDPIQSRIVQAVILGNAQANNLIAQNEELGTNATLRATLLNHLIVIKARERLRGTEVRAEYIGNAWRWNLHDRALLHFKKAGADGLPCNNYSTKQSLQYVNSPKGHQESLFPPPDMLTALYTLDPQKQEHVINIQIIRMQGKTRYDWEYSILNKAGIAGPSKQEVIADVMPPTVVRLKKTKKNASDGAQ